MEGEPKNDFEMLKREIEQSPENIEREFANTDNIWLACVATRINVIMAYIEICQEDGLISEEQGKNYLDKAKSLGSYVLELQETYSEKTSEIPKELKEDIISRLNVLE